MYPSYAVIKDYADLNCTDTATGKITKMDFPTTSNVLQFITTDGTKISIRPSGTEPKIKFYIEVHDKMKDMDDYDRCNRDAAAKNTLSQINKPVLAGLKIFMLFCIC